VPPRKVEPALLLVNKLVGAFFPQCRAQSCLVGGRNFNIARRCVQHSDEIFYVQKSSLSFQISRASFFCFFGALFTTHFDDAKVAW
jgi:hypothetical protein